MAYLFDIDGVLNEAQQPVGRDIIAALVSLSVHNPVYFVTGNTFTKAKDMLGDELTFCEGIFCNNADELRSMSGRKIWEDTETPPLPYIEFDVWPFNNTIEWRSPRFVNYSRIGRYAPQAVRDNHDANWRDWFVGWVKQAYDVDASIGGKVSVDIYSRGADKSRAGKWLNAHGQPYTFFGDKTDLGGNDFPLVEHCTRTTGNKVITVFGPQDTLRHINEQI